MFVNFEMRFSQTRINKIHREFHLTLENEICKDDSTINILFSQSYMISPNDCRDMCVLCLT